MKKMLFCVLLIISAIFCMQEVYAQNVYYVATSGDDENPGSFDEPFVSVQKAVTLAQPGDTVYIRGGVYEMKDAIYYGTYRTSAIVILIRPGNNIGRSGKAGSPIHFFNYPGETPIFDCSAVEPGHYNQGITIEYAEHIHLRGLTIRNVRQKEYDGVRYSEAMGIAASPAANLRFENITVHDIGGRGFWFAGGAWNEWDGPNARFESDTTIWINCDAYNLFDGFSSSPGNAADGWKAHNYQGNLMRWEGCRAWNYSDDGIDPSGSGVRILNNCWAMSTDKYSGLSEEWNIEGNGFKFAATWAEVYATEPLEPLVIMTNCIAADCKSVGIANNLEGDLQNNAHFYNNLAYKCYSGFHDRNNHAFRPSPRRTTYYNNLVYASHSEYPEHTDIYKQVMIYRPSIYTAENNTWVPTMLEDSWDGWKYNDNFYPVTDNDFVSLDLSQLTASRKDGGSLPDITFGRLTPGNRMKGAGTNVGMSENPDIGIDWAWLDAGGGVATAQASKSILSRSSPAFKFSTTRGAIVIEHGVSQRASIEVALYDGRGRRVTLQHNTPGESVRIETKAFAPGVYTMRIRIDGKNHTRRVVVSRQGRVGM